MDYTAPRREGVHDASITTDRPRNALFIMTHFWAHIKPGSTRKVAPPGTLTSLSRLFLDAMLCKTPGLVLIDANLTSKLFHVRMRAPYGVLLKQIVLLNYVLLTLRGNIATVQVDPLKGNLAHDSSGSPKA